MQRLYLDTSVFGGYFDEEFAEFTIPLFERLNEGKFILLFSSVTQDELTDAPPRVRNLVIEIKAGFTEFLEVEDISVDLATKYISEKVVGPTSYADCLHIALATIAKADYLVSWNFKHIVNVQRIRGYNSVNVSSGYQELEIRSPRDFMGYGNNN